LEKHTISIFRVEYRGITFSERWYLPHGFTTQKNVEMPDFDVDKCSVLNVTDESPAIVAELELRSAVFCRRFAVFSS
jgi:hypothetical protein